MSEADIQKKFISWCRINGLLFFSPINENPYSKYMKKEILYKIEADLKAMGKSKGVNDVFVYLPSVLLHIEFKIGKNKQSFEQVAFEKNVNKFSYCKYALCYSFEEATNAVLQNSK